MTRVPATTEMRQPRSDEWKGAESTIHGRPRGVCTSKVTQRNPTESSSTRGTRVACTQDASLRATGSRVTAEGRAACVESRPA
eukprot:4708278-Pyramimonas_sp.AAC.1